MPETTTVEVTTYTLEELEEESTTGYYNALSWLSEGSVSYDWWDAALDGINEMWRDKYGIQFRDDEVTFSVGDRGEYFAVSTTDVDTRRVLKAAGIDLRTKVAREMLDSDRLVLKTERSGFSGERMLLGYDLYDGYLPDYLEEMSPGIHDKLSDVRDDLEASALKVLRDEYEYLTSEEYLKEMAEANEYRFTIDGKVFHD